MKVKQSKVCFCSFVVWHYYLIIAALASARVMFPFYRSAFSLYYTTTIVSNIIYNNRNNISDILIILNKNIARLYMCNYLQLIF